MIVLHPVCVLLTISKSIKSGLIMANSSLPLSLSASGVKKIEALYHKAFLWKYDKKHFSQVIKYFSVTLAFLFFYDTKHFMEYFMGVQSYLLLLVRLWVFKICCISRMFFSSTAKLTLYLWLLDACSRDWSCSCLYLLYSWGKLCKYEMLLSYKPPCH